MRLILEIAVGYCLGRLAARFGDTLAKVLLRRLVLSSPKWQERIRHDDDLDGQLLRAIGRRRPEDS